MNINCSPKTILSIISDRGFDIVKTSGEEIDQEQRYDINSIDDISDLSLCWIGNQRITSLNMLTHVSSCILILDYTLKDEAYEKEKNHFFIFVRQPRIVYAELLNHFLSESESRDVHSSAVISPKAIIEDNVKIGANTVIGECYIKHGCTIGSNCSILDGTYLEQEVEIGSNTVIGDTGFGYYKLGNKQKRFPHIGGVLIEEGVHIGANTTIDRGTLGNTVLKKFSRIDNLVHIAHNVIVGENTMVIANSMIAGSSIIGSNVWISPSVSILDGISIGDNSLIGMNSVVLKSVPSDEIWVGNPAKFLKARV